MDSSEQSSSFPPEDNDEKEESLSEEPEGDKNVRMRNFLTARQTTDQDDSSEADDTDDSFVSSEEEASQWNRSEGEHFDDSVSESVFEDKKEKDDHESDTTSDWPIY